MPYPQNLKELLSTEQHRIDFIEQYSHMLSPHEALKFKIFKDIVYFFQKYPTLYSIGISHYHDSSFKGWMPYTVAVGWDSMREISKNQPEGSGCVGIYIHNTMNDLREKMIIPYQNTQKKTNWNTIYHEVKNHLNYMNDPDNKSFSRDLYVEQQGYSFKFHTYSDYGHFNFNLISDFEKWLGVSQKLTYLDLDSKLSRCDKEISIRKI